MLEVKSVRRAKLPSSLLPHPSPASIQPTRLALHVTDQEDGDHLSASCCAYFASGRRVYKAQIPMGELPVDSGKDSLLIPAHVEVTKASIVERCPHQSEIQSIALTQMGGTQSSVLGSVASCGHLIVSNLDGEETQRFTFSVSPRDIGVGEGSWAGLSFSPIQWSTVAVARSLARSIDIYDQEIHLTNLRTLWYPSSLTFVQCQHFGTESSILAVTEGCQLTMWDLRMKENGGCLKRLCGSGGDILYATSISSDGNIAVGGADRTITIYDPRRWSPVSRWVHCSKYEITGLAFSSAHPDYIYVQGVDYEVFCGQWKEATKVFSFRGDSNWLGFSKCNDADVIGGWSDSGSMFVADIVAKNDK